MHPMNKETINSSGGNPDCEIVSSRVFDCNPEFMFRAWSEPEHLKNWWGPAGFTNTFNEFDFRVGGRWRLVMHGPDKGNYVNECEFLLNNPPSQIIWKRHTQPFFNVEVSFSQLPEGKTLLVFKMKFDNARDCQKVKKFAVDKNEENFDRLELELQSMAKRSENFSE